MQLHRWDLYTKQVIKDLFFHNLDMVRTKQMDCISICKWWKGFRRIRQGNRAINIIQTTSKIIRRIRDRQESTTISSNNSGRQVCKIGRRWRSRIKRSSNNSNWSTSSNWLIRSSWQRMAAKMDNRTTQVISSNLRSNKTMCLLTKVIFVSFNSSTRNIYEWSSPATIHSVATYCHGVRLPNKIHCFHSMKVS